GDAAGSGFGRKVRGLKATAEELPDYVERVLRRFLGARGGGGAFAGRAPRGRGGEPGIAARRAARGRSASPASGGGGLGPRGGRERMANGIAAAAPGASSFASPAWGPRYEWRWDYAK